MNKENRTELRCSKTLASGVVDSFSVIVPTSARNDAKKKYESMGYAVSGRWKMDKELEEISKVVESDLKKNYIKNMIQGFEIANKMILDKINSGATLEEVKKMVELNLKNKKVVEKVAMGKKGWLRITK